ncbi:MAG: filamentation induced by cAMP protein Fic [candidate division CPR1 bacterium GW2011_GWA2_42_17]|uniref:Filamentation induced by cAMP protein Fic n=1 Tax=candidate division CPR1 bacterium GW2011_GWA2_42_17 TaxID=1618341 RepID=A0A0G0Z5T7_9BACT|nr:MAG: filamentation induced by cAMP protein Fic [candidate division CPR1 bacterium GW2011_GWA2_42_17]
MSKSRNLCVMPKRPENEEELQKREAIGVIRASRFVRRYAHSHKAITTETILDVHREIFKDAWTEIVGKYRDENLEITESKHLPPHHSVVAEQMVNVGRELSLRTGSLREKEGVLMNTLLPIEKVYEEVERIVDTAAWIHHQITFVHPFREGNGRTARLFANLILERYGLVGISIKMEKENKNRYRAALAQADATKDLEPLKAIIYDGIIDRYKGVRLKYY